MMDGGRGGEKTEATYISNQQDYGNETKAGETMEPKDKKRIIKIVAVAVIIIVITAITIAILMADDGIDLIYVIVDKVDDGLRVRAIADPSGMGEVNGDGNIVIEHDGNIVYEGKIGFKNDNADETVGFQDFVEGNGEYIVTVSYNDKSGSRTYDVDWVTEYIYVYGFLHDITPITTPDGSSMLGIEKGKLSLYITPIKSEGIKLFTIATSFKSELDNYRISDDLIDEFKGNGKSISVEDNFGVISMNDDEWLITNNIMLYLIREEGSGLSVYQWSSGLEAAPENVEVDLEIYYEGARQHEESFALTSTMKTYEKFDYYTTGAGDYEFRITAINTQIKPDSAIYDGVTSTQKKFLNHRPWASLDFDKYPEDNEKHQSRTVEVTSSQASAGYEITFDAGESINDGPLEYAWDWDYYNDRVEEEEPFDVEDTGEKVAHTFNPDLSLISPNDHYYIGLQVTGEEDVEVQDDVDGSMHIEKESHTIIIHIHFKLTF